METFHSKKRREFLFSEECVKYEIKEHIVGLMSSLGYYQYGLTPLYMTGQGGIDLIENTMTKITNIFRTEKKEAVIKLPHGYVKDHCEIIDISEGDVYDKYQAYFFKYREGIHPRYKNTIADPYWDAQSGDRSDKLSANPNKPEWEGELYNYGKL